LDDILKNLEEFNEKKVSNGGNPNEWDLSPLIKDIEKLHIEALDYIILDFPFAYQHSKTRNLLILQCLLIRH
jgi:hypothetical protein